MLTDTLGVRLPPPETIVSGIKDCVRKIATVGDNHQKVALLAEGISVLCQVLRRMVIPHDELARIAAALTEIQKMDEGAKLWEAYQTSGQNPIQFAIDNLKEYAESGAAPKAQL